MPTLKDEIPVARIRAYGRVGSANDRKTSWSWRWLDLPLPTFVPRLLQRPGYPACRPPD